MSLDRKSYHEYVTKDYMRKIKIHTYENLQITSHVLKFKDEEE